MELPAGELTVIVLVVAKHIAKQGDSVVSQLSLSNLDARSVQMLLCIKLLMIPIMF